MLSTSRGRSTQSFAPTQRGASRPLLDAVRGNNLEALYVLALTTGMRQGELLGLAWSDVEWDGRRLHVRHTLSRKRGRWWLAIPRPRRAGARLN